MEKKLPITYPPITTYLSHGYNLSALMNYEEFLPWFYSNYIQLKCLKELTQELDCDLNFYFPDGLDYLQRIPFVKTQFIFKDIMSYWRCNVSDFFKNIINEGYYICTFVDEYYIPSKILFQKKHNSHRIFIYGFDDELEIFNICGWDINQVFNINEIVKYKDLSAAFGSDHNTDILLSRRGTLCFKLDNNYFKSHQYNFDIKYVYRILNEYLLSYNTSENFCMYYNRLDPAKYSLGMNVYNDFNNYLKKLADNQAKASRIAAHAIWEHKKCMLMRISYLKKMKYISENSMYENSYLEIERKASICRNLMLKYQLTSDSSIIFSMMNLIRNIENEERYLLEQLIEDIKYTNNV